MKPLVTVITPTTGSDQLTDALNSVDKQTYTNIQHLVVIDGVNKYGDKAKKLIEGASRSTIVELPYNTGYDNYNGHRIYGAMSYIAQGDFVCFLDQDNWFESNHIESLVNVILDGNQWAYSLRKIVSQEGEYICNDDCESLGKWASVLNDQFVDVNCYMIPKMAAIAFSPYWYRRARHPQEQPEVDRILSVFMMQNFTKFDTNGDYTVNYRVASRKDSVQDSFFLRGNEMMQNKMKGEYPWRKKT
jgi:glycosyltransferase involved in cell wall biosynthesis